MSSPLQPAVQPAAPALAQPIGHTWSLEVSGVPAAALEGDRGKVLLQSLFAALVEELNLHPVAAGTWHVFPAPHRGVTGILALSESHLACHSFPEFGGLTLDLYTCRARQAPDWASVLRRLLGGEPRVCVRESRRYLEGGSGR